MLAGVASISVLPFHGRRKTQLKPLWAGALASEALGRWSLPGFLMTGQKWRPLQASGHRQSARPASPATVPSPRGSELLTTAQLLSAPLIGFYSLFWHRTRSIHHPHRIDNSKRHKPPSHLFQIFITKLSFSLSLILQQVRLTDIKPCFLCHSYSSIKVCSTFECLLKAGISLYGCPEGSELLC